MLEDQDAASYTYGADALAIGEDTFTEVDSTSKIADHGPVTTAKIDIKATAVAQSDPTVAESDPMVAEADTYVESNFDISILRKFEEKSLAYDGVSYDISEATFIGVKLPDDVTLPGEQMKKEIVIRRDGDPDWNPELDGNVAVLSVEAEAPGDNTLVTAEVGLLTVEDTVSYSGLEVTSAVA